MALYSTVCPRNCYSTCSFKVRIEDGKVCHFEPHPDNKATPEGMCLKGLSYIERANSEDRILYPLRKNPATEKFERISWDEALATIADKLKYFKNTYGCQSVFFYQGSGMSGLLNEFSSKFWKLYGGATTHYGSLCWSAGLEATRLTLGENKHNAPWDLENARLIVIWGKNSAESNVQEMIPLEKAQSKGASLVVIDTRRTQTAERADLLIQPLPGTDAALALAVAYILIERNQINRDFIDNHVLGFEYFKELVKSYTPQSAAQICDIPIELIYRLADYIANIRPLTLIAGYGVQRYSNGGQTIRAILSLVILTGNIGKSGAGWQYANLQSYIFDNIKEPLSYYPEKDKEDLFRRTISVAKIGADLLDQKDPPVKMIWVERGNPVTSNPETLTVLKAFHLLEFRVVIDQFMTDTALEADIVLPAKNMFEQSDIVGSYWNPYVQLRQKVVEFAGEVKPETEIYYLLALKLGFSETEIQKYLIQPGDEQIEQFIKTKLDTFPELNYEELKQRPQLPISHEEVVFKDLIFNTPSGKIELYSEKAKELWNVDYMPSYIELEEGKNSKSDVSVQYPLFLMSPNSKNRIHSQFNNLKIIKMLSPYPVVYIHPLDARVRSIKHKDLVRVYNGRGAFELEANFDLGIKQGCIAIPNGWWISQGGTVNYLSKGRETDMGHGTAFHDNMVEVEKIV